MLDPRRLLTFREVAVQGSFSRAAESLALSQPAVSQQISALEAELGTELLTRGRAGAVPTAAGGLLLEHADSMAARLELAGTQMETLAADQRRSLRLGAFPSAIASIVPAAVARLRDGEPELEVAIEEGTLTELPRLVQSGRLDLAVLFQDAAERRREHDGLVRVDLAEEPMVAMISSEHRLAGEERIALKQLAKDAWTAPSPDGIVVKACRAAGFEPRLAIITRDTLAVRAIAAEGLAVTITPSLLAGIGLPGVATPGLKGRRPRRSIYAVVPEAGAHPLASALIEALAEKA